MERDAKTDEAVYTALRGVLGPDYEMELQDLKRAAKAACDAFMAAQNPPMAFVGREELARLDLLDSQMVTAAEEASRQVRAWVMRQLLVEREWLHDLVSQLPAGWTLCVHRRATAHLGRFQVDAHSLQGDAACAWVLAPSTMVERYGPKPDL